MACCIIAIANSINDAYFKSATRINVLLRSSVELLLSLSFLSIPSASVVCLWLMAYLNTLVLTNLILLSPWFLSFLLFASAFLCFTLALDCISCWPLTSRWTVCTEVEVQGYQWGAGPCPQWYDLSIDHFFRTCAKRPLLLYSVGLSVLLWYLEPRAISPVICALLSLSLLMLGFNKSLVFLCILQFVCLLFSSASILTIGTI